MPPKRAKKPTPRNGSTAMASADEVLDPGKPVLYIEHCRSCHTYGQRAKEIHDTLQQRGLTQLQLQLNAMDRPPRRGAFEISFALRPTAEETEQQALWSGLKRTPRAQKWPNTHALYEKIVLALKKDQDQQQKEEPKKKKDQDQQQKEEPKTKEKPKSAATPKTPKKRKADASDNLEPRSTRSSSAKRSKKSSPKNK